MDITIGHDELSHFSALVPSLAPWMHAFRFGERLIVGKYEGLTLDQTYCTPSSPADVIARMQHAYESRLHAVHWQFYDQLISCVPESERADLSVLDIASATGAFCFWAVDRGFGRVISSEIRENQLEQQRLIARSAVREDYRSKITHIHDVVSADAPEFVERYKPMKPDIVFSFGLLYHLTNPVQHLRNLYEIAGSRVFMYTRAHLMTGAETAWDMRLENPELITQAVEGISWSPHFYGLLNVARRVGFANVRVAYPRQFAVNLPGYETYRRNTRVRMQLADFAHKAGLTIGYRRNLRRAFYHRTGFSPYYFGYVFEK